MSIATGFLAYPYMEKFARRLEDKLVRTKIHVYPIKNDFFGHSITVAGLVTATDIIEQLRGKDLGDELLIPAVMLRNERDMFLDSITVDELSKALETPVTVVEVDGFDLVAKISGEVI